MMHQKKHIPFPSVLFLQFDILVCLWPVSLIFCFHPSILGRTIAIIVSSLLAVGDVLSIILSLTIGWNIPIAFGKDGISKKGKVYRWCDVTSVTMKGVGPTGRGLLIPRMTTVVYSDGESIRFDLGLIFEEEIKKVCGDERFLAMLENAKPYHDD